MKKCLIQLLVVALVFNITYSAMGLASNFSDDSIEANARKIDLDVDYSVNEISSEDSKSVYRINVEDDLGISNKNFEMQVEEFSMNEIGISSHLISEYFDFYSYMHINIDSGEMFVNLKENGKDREYDLIFVEIEGENFKALLVDKDTEEVFLMNTIDANASAIPVLAIVIQQGARWAIKKYGEKALISAFGKYALSNAIKKLPNFIVKNKHLSSSTSNWAKFNTNSQTTAKGWIKEALQKASVSDFEINYNDKLSFKFDVNLNKKIGTKGETKIRIVIGYDGNIWTTFPVK